jgi:hypothetical protein
MGIPAVSSSLTSSGREAMLDTYRPVADHQSVDTDAGSCNPNASVPSTAASSCPSPLMQWWAAPSRSPPASTTEAEITPSTTSMTPSFAPSSTSAPADLPTSDAFVTLGCYTAVGNFQNFRLELTSDLMTVNLDVEACQGQQFAGTYDQQIFSPKTESPEG